MKTKIMEIRTEVRNKKQKWNGSQKGKNTNQKVVPKPSGDALPAQYPNMINNTQQLASLLNVTSQDLADSEEETDDEDLISQLLVSHVATVADDDDIEVRAHFEYAEAYADKIYAISDGGADSCVLGKHAHVIHHTGRTATLVGYDPRTTRTTKVPIVSAYLKVMSHVGIPVFLKVNQAPYHKDNDITLISEYQVREHKYVIDSVASKHLKAPDVYGTQRLDLSDAIHVKFEDRGGIMGFELLEISNEDFDGDEPLYDVFEITGQDTWIPKHFQQILTSTSYPSPEGTPDPEASPTASPTEPGVPMEENEVFWDAQTPEVDPEPYYFDPEDPEEDIQLSFAHLKLFPERY